MSPSMNKFYKACTKNFEEMCVIYGAADENGHYPGFCSDPFCRKDFKADVLRHHAPRILFGLSWFVMCVFCNNLSQAWLQRNIAGYYETHWQPVAPMNQTVTLYDATFQLLPFIRTTAPADVFANLAPAIMSIRFLVLPGPLSLRWTVVQRLSLLWGTLFLFRSITTIITPLPNPDHTCVPKLSYPNNMFLQALAIFRGDLTCQDVLFSGHTVAITLPMLFVFKYLALAPWSVLDANTGWLSFSTLANNLGVPFILAGYYCIAGSHFHYTIDVFVGALLCLLVFTAYHHLVQVVLLRKLHGGHRFYDFLVDWFERDAKDLRHWEVKAARHQDAFEDMWLHHAI